MNWLIALTSFGVALALRKWILPYLSWKWKVRQYKRSLKSLSKAIRKKISTAKDPEALKEKMIEFEKAVEELFEKLESEAKDILDKKL